MYVLVICRTGDWFCSEQCSHIRDTLNGQVARGVLPLEGGLSWQMLRGIDGSDASSTALATATTLLQVPVLYNCPLLP